MQYQPRHAKDEIQFHPMGYDMTNYLSSHGNSCQPVEDFPAQNVQQKCRDYGKGRATTRRRTSVTDTDADLWRRCNKLLRAEKKLSKLFITSTCIHVIVLVFVTISVSPCSKSSRFQCSYVYTPILHALTYTYVSIRC